MKHAFFLLLGTLAVLAGCESKAGTGALVGAGVGVGAGALIGHSVGGAAIGAGAGAIGGALIGSALESGERDNLQEKSPHTLDRIDQETQLSLDDIKSMSQAGISDDKIISTIHSTGSIYYLSPADEQDLKNAGVSAHVINYMKQTAYQ
jgi:hypothetical protein